MNIVSAILIVVFIGYVVTKMIGKPGGAKDPRATDLRARPKRGRK